METAADLFSSMHFLGLIVVSIAHAGLAAIHSAGTGMQSFRQGQLRKPPTTQQRQSQVRLFEQANSYRKGDYSRGMEIGVSHEGGRLLVQHFGRTIATHNRRQDEPGACAAPRWP